MDGKGIQIKVTSDKQIKGNKISTNEGYYILVKYIRENYTITIKWILMGQLYVNDWYRQDGTQFAFLTKEARIRLEEVYP